MFIQEFHGKVRDKALLDKQMEIWQKEIRPKAKGFLGSTVGVTPDGTMVTVARFESEELAHQNSDMPEQTAWFEKTSKAFDGELTFHDYTDVDTYGDETTNDAHFVQVMQGHAKDMRAMRAMEAEFDDQMSKIRPDIIGTVTGWEPDGSFTTVAYFTSEAEARKNETAMAKDPTFQQYMQQVDGEMKYYDIKEPLFV
jgi:hypothetical protein